MICRLSLLISAVVLCSCAPTKGYSGPELEPQQLSEIFFTSSEVRTSHELTNGIQMGFSPRILVLPGEQEVTFTYTFNTAAGTTFTLSEPWTKSGTCAVVFETVAANDYGISPVLIRNQLVPSQPTVLVTVQEKHHADYTFQNKLTSAMCTPDK